ncbi:hypothetical protein [Pseudoduganella sp. UC29_71]|uniref:hypothetical protein n=1 Tax=Pseudoduganella sp. UC29_71 TaxID=3350174 RepID=UPI003672092E
MYAGADLQLRAKGKIENLYAGQTRFTAQDGAGQPSAGHVWPGAPLAHGEAMRYLVEYAQGHLQGHRVMAIGHRIVHGGMEFSGPVKLDEDVLARLDTLVPLAPLHQPHNLAPVRSIFALAPHVLQVGCFDTAFHTAQPPLAQAFALPPEITERGVRRYGFHGLSYEYVASVLPALDDAQAAPPPAGSAAARPRKPEWGRRAGCRRCRRCYRCCWVARLLLPRMRRWAARRRRRHAMPRRWPAGAW